MDKEAQFDLIYIGMLLERYGNMTKEDPETLEDIENYIFNTFGIYVYKHQQIEGVLQNIKNQI